MSSRNARGIVVLGMLTKMPVPGVIWQTLHYLVGLRRLGYDVTYVEAHARTPSSFSREEGDPGSRAAADFLRGLLTRFGFGDRWAFHALHDDGSCYGLDRERLERTYASAEMLLNLHGGTRPLPEHAATGRLVFVGTDPCQLEVELWRGRQKTHDFLEAHRAWFTFGENYGAPDCGLPVSDRFELTPTRQPVVLDFWEGDVPDHGRYTTVGNWRQRDRKVRYRGEVYHWSKDLEFRKFLDVPGRTGLDFELALSSIGPPGRELLVRNGWGVRDAAELSGDPDRYRDYIRRSRGEFTVAKDQNVRLRSGWFSDRSATYLAAGRPVVTQETGFSSVLPTGGGLFGFTTTDEAVASLEAIEADYAAACREARRVARECFDYRVVLPRLLTDAGVEGPGRPHPVGGGAWHEPPFPEDLVLEPVSRRPLRLAEETVRTITARALPVAAEPEGPLGAPEAGAGEDGSPAGPAVSVIVVTYGQLALTRLCLETLLAHTGHPRYEVVVVDNGSTDGTPSYLRALASRHRVVRPILNPSNEGFARACNQGARAAVGDTLVFLNNDTVLAPGWLTTLVAHLEDPEVGAVNPVTNRIGTEAEVPCSPRDYGGFLEAARARREEWRGSRRAAEMLAFFCLALRRSVWDEVGGLDEGYGQGLFEDDDYSMRLGRAGYRLWCAEDVLVHHFGEASFGELVPDGSYGRLFERNRRRFETRWGRPWSRRRGGPDPDYRAQVARIRAEVGEWLPGDVTVAVVSRGDERLLKLDGRTAWHFPRQDDGTWAGYYPADGREAVAHLESLRCRGARYLLLPAPAFWWLDHYEELRDHLEARAGVVVRRSDDLILYRLAREGEGNGAGGGARAAAATAAVAAGEAGGVGAAPEAEAAHESSAGVAEPPGEERAAGPAARKGGPAAATAVPREGDVPSRPVFIIGSPRSGTSVLTWALGQHPNLYPLEETAWFGPLHRGSAKAFEIGSSRGDLSQLSAMGIERDEFFEALGDALDGIIRRHRRWPGAPVDADHAFVRARSPDHPKGRWVDGTPQNSFHVDGLVELFPRATFIHLLRRPDLVVRSLQRFHNIGGRRHTAGEAYRKWIGHVRASLEAERTLGPERVVRVLHRDLASSPEGVVRTCLEFVGEAYTPDCLLPLRHRINSSGDTPLPEGSGEEDGPPDPEVVAEARALEAELFPEAEAPR